MTERTPLTSAPPYEGGGQGYVEQIPYHPTKLGSSSGIRDRQVKRFQCLICSSILGALTIALFMFVAYIIVRDDAGIIPFDNSTDPSNSSSDGNVMPLPNVITFLTLPLEDEKMNTWSSEPSDEDIKEAIKAGEIALGEKDIIESQLLSPAINTPTYRHQKAVSTSPASRKASLQGYLENYATIFIAKKNNIKKLSKRWSIGRGPKLTKDKIEDHSFCNYNSKYRTPNGTCNNKNNPLTYGVAMRPFRRHMIPDYADGISSPRASTEKEELASARQISLEIHRPAYTSDPHFSVMLAVWGQFLDHDITSTALSQGSNGEAIDCCSDNTVRHPECFPVPIGPGDPYFHQYNLTCMNFVRSIPAPTSHFGPREQFNQASSFIDGSVVYGNDDAKMNALRSGSGGRLRMFRTPDNRELLPISTNPNDGCNRADMNAAGKYCFESGDDRSNENLHLTSMHLIWARHHNYLCDGLAAMNPDWNDEKLFQEARKILGAQMQHITYDEFLPIVLGDETTEKFEMKPEPFKQTDTYNATIDPSVANAFAAAAFRFAHTLLPGLMRATKDPTSSKTGIELHRMLFNPYSLYGATGLDDALQGAMSTQILKFDPYFSTELSQKLFEQDSDSVLLDRPCGLDLVSLNIQRGRDHGLPAYPEWRKFCKLSPVDTWDQLSKVVDEDSYRRMKEIYKEPQNIDIYSGSISEPPVNGGIIGPLMTCLISDQYVRLKRGDSFWYERRIGPQRFTNDQLKQIYDTKLSSIICRNSDAVKYSPKFVMRKTDNNNPEIDCRELDTFEFGPWKENGNKYESKIAIDSNQAKVLIKN